MIVRIKKILRIFFALFRQTFDLSNWQKIPFLRVYFSIKNMRVARVDEKKIENDIRPARGSAPFARVEITYCDIKSPVLRYGKISKKFYRLPCN